MIRIFLKFYQNTLGLFKDMRIFSLLHKDMNNMEWSLHFSRDPCIEAIVGYSIQNITNEVTQVFVKIRSTFKHFFILSFTTISL